uniref:Uncharacterized protein n=1 Tax=Sinocyclocheilus rhinocerous TaxID=307959 RepID=A0A673IQ45_9TELE
RAAPEPIPLISQVSGVFLMKMRIGTHNGTFHCDEVLACFLLRQLPECKVRRGDRTQCDVVVDVGGEYRWITLRIISLCPEKRWVKKLSSAVQSSGQYHTFLQSYKEYCLNMKTFPSQEDFQKALALVGAEFKDRLHYYMKAWLPAREIMQQAVQSRYQVIHISTLHCCPWKEHLFVLEKQLKLDVLIKFVLYPDQSGHWRVQCVLAGLNTFQNRLSLLEEWRGLLVHAHSKIRSVQTHIL